MGIVTCCGVRIVLKNTAIQHERARGVDVDCRDYCGVVYPRLGVYNLRLHAYRRCPVALGKKRQREIVSWSKSTLEILDQRVSRSGGSEYEVVICLIPIRERAGNIANRIAKEVLPTL